MSHVATRAPGVVTGVICSSEAELQEVINTYSLPPKWRVVSQGAKFILAAEAGGEVVLPEYQAVLNYATAQGFAKPSASQQSAQNAFLAALIDAGIWNLLDVFYNFLTDGSFDFALINWKAPGTFQGVATPEISFYPDKGVNNPLAGAGQITVNPLNLNHPNYADIPLAFFSSIGDWNGILGSESIMDGGNAGFTYMVVNFNAVSGRCNFNIYQGGGVNLAPDIQGDQSGFNMMFADVDFPTGKAIMPLGQSVSSNIYVGPLTNTPVKLAGFTGVAPIHNYKLEMYGQASIGGAEYQTLKDIWNAYKQPFEIANAYKKIIDYATAQGFALPSAPVQEKGKALVKTLFEKNIWQNLDVFYNFFTDGDNNFAKINWINPGVNDADGTGHDLPFAVNSGFSSVTGTEYFETGFTPTLAKKWKVNDAAWIVGLGDNGVGGGIDMGDNVLNQPFFRFTGGGNVQLNIDSASQMAGVFPGSLELTHFQKRPDNIYRLFRQGVEVGTAPSGNSVLGGVSFHINGFNNGAGGHNNGNVGRLWQLIVFGASLAGHELDLYNAWTTYKI